MAVKARFRRLPGGGLIGGAVRSPETPGDLSKQDQERNEVTIVVAVVSSEVSCLL